MKVDDFDFDLPQKFIAQRPVKPRHAARLLHVADQLRDFSVMDLPGLLNPGDILVFNDTRVIPARLLGNRVSENIPAGQGAKIEVTLHKRESDDTWAVFARPGKKLKPETVIRFSDDFSATVIEKHDGGEVILRFNKGGNDLMNALEDQGGMPLPPYIKREGLADDQDRQDYQTRFADKKGAVAAPTAGLHFTDELMAAIEARGLQITHVTLHVGAGTFLPVKVDDTDEHKMHHEWGEVSAEAANKINTVRQAGGKVVAVGTTSLRLLESAANDSGTLHAYADETDIFITPGYRFKIVDRLLTNFHLPRSTLFMLVSAFAGLNRMKDVYTHAMDNNYRFYSYGDCTLLFPTELFPKEDHT